MSLLLYVRCTWLRRWWSVFVKIDIMKAESRTFLWKWQKVKSVRKMRWDEWQRWWQLILHTCMRRLPLRPLHAVTKMVCHIMVNGEAKYVQFSFLNHKILQQPVVGAVMVTQWARHSCYWSIFISQGQNAKAQKVFDTQTGVICARLRHILRFAEFRMYTCKHGKEVTSLCAYVSVVVVFFFNAPARVARTGASLYSAFIRLLIISSMEILCCANSSSLYFLYYMALHR